MSIVSFRADALREILGYVVQLLATQPKDFCGKGTESVVRIVAQNLLFARRTASQNGLTFRPVIVRIRHSRNPGETMPYAKAANMLDLGGAAAIFSRSLPL